MNKEEAIKIVPLNGNIVVVDDPPIKKTKGGIYLPDSDKSRMLVVRGTVLAVSDITVKGGKKIPPEVKPGDKVIYNFLSGTAGLTEPSDKEPDVFYRVIEHSCIIAKVE